MYRGRIETLDPARPVAGSLLIADGVVIGIDVADDEYDGAPDVYVVELGRGETIRPGYMDRHLHLLAGAARCLSVDVSRCERVDEVLHAIAEAPTPATGWLRVWGYDDALLAEGRHLSRFELDEVCGGRPLVLHHRSGHVVVLNSLGLESIGLADHADGVLVDAHDLVAQVPRLDEGQLGSGLRADLTAMSERGIVSVTDATHTNDLAALELISRLSGRVGPRIEAMVGADRLSGLSYGSQVGDVAVGHAKVMPVEGRDDLMAQQVGMAREAGFPVAVHVMDVDTLAVALEALGSSSPPRGTVDRLEHAALALPEQLDEIARLGLYVVTQPSFVVHRGAKYRTELSEVEREWLWPVASLIDRGVGVGFSSDSPVVPAAPLEWIAAASEREIGPGEAVDEAIAVTLASAGPMREGIEVAMLVIEHNSEHRPLTPPKPFS